MNDKLKYDKEMYLDSGFYDGGFGDNEVSCYKEKLVKCRKEHKCLSCNKDILIGSYSIHESGFMDNHAVSCYTCIECIEKWLEESGQVDNGED